LKGEKQMKKKGFTLVELLVVIAIIALLMSILMPTLAKVRAMALRAVCSTNLSSLHKAFLAYAHDNFQEYPRAGGKTSQWRISTSLPLPVFYERNEIRAFHKEGSATGDSYATIGASLYFLIKYADAAPKEFICGGDSGAVEFELSLYKSVIPATTSLARQQDITLAWDFGGPPNENGDPPARHYSYSYHMPYCQTRQMYYTLSTSRQPDIPVMADRNPYLVLIQEATPPYVYGNSEQEKWGNSPSHKYEGQNVLFNDSSVSWETVPYCGINHDNIYTYALDPDNPQVGTRPRKFSGAAYPRSGDDSLLVNEGAEQLEE
jgi:prepilin-type N-terminal cleavage/methylation domain-containing protein